MLAQIWPLLGKSGLARTSQRALARSPLALFAVIATGCRSLEPRDFAGSRTVFDPDTYFLGHTYSWGVIENRSGEPSSRFSTECHGRRNQAGDVVIEQTFHFEGGRTQQRTWQVHRIDPHHYQATANDVVGLARGQPHGNAFRWEYTIALKPGNPLFNVHLRQWMYLPEGSETMFTRVEVTKFGITLQQITESFRKSPGSLAVIRNKNPLTVSQRAGLN